MLVRSADRRAGSTLAEWTWTAPRPRDPRPGESAIRRARLATALRVGHGLGLSFGARVVAGPSPRLSLFGSSPATARWLARVVLPLNGRAAWSRQAPSDDDRSFDVEWAHRRRSWPERLCDANDGPSSLGAMALALSGAHAGVRVVWEFSPTAPSWSPPPGLGSEEPQPVVDRRTVASRRRETNRSAPSAEASSAPLFWRSSATLEYPRDVARDRELRRAIRVVVEGATRSSRANGLRFSRPGILGAWGPPMFEVSDEELLALLPDLAHDGGLCGDDLPGAQPLLPIGRSPAGRLVGPPLEGTQGRHLAILGETGMGKSATLVALARKAADHGGVVLLDPLGGSARAFVQGLSREDRRERLLWIAPEGDSAGINALEGIGHGDTDPVRSDRRLNDLVHALRRVRSGRYESKYWGPRLEEMLTMALGAAALLPSGTMTEAHTLLATGGRTRCVAPPGAMDAVRALADRVRERPDDAEGARRLLFEVVRSPVLRRMLCAPEPRRHTEEFVRPGRIAVVSGEAATVGETAARYLLAVYLALVWSELLARPSASKTFVVLDEAPWYAHESLAEMLRLARQRNVHVLLASQTVGSFAEELRDAVWANVSDFVAFRGSPDEARELARATSEVSVEELLALPRGHAAVLLGKGNSVHWVRTVGRPTIDFGTANSPAGAPSEAVRAGTVVDVLNWLRKQASAQTVPGPLRVRLTELRDSVDPGGSSVREAGGVLGRCGALLATVREEGGSVWWVDPEKIPRWPAGSAAPALTGAAEAPQLS